MSSIGICQIRKGDIYVPKCRFDVSFNLTFSCFEAAHFRTVRKLRLNSHLPRAIITRGLYSLLRHLRSRFVVILL
jgi:hypothetical protein